MEHTIENYADIRIRTEEPVSLRLTLGRYLNEPWKKFAHRIREAGIDARELTDAEIFAGTMVHSIENDTKKWFRARKDGADIVESAKRELNTYGVRVDQQRRAQKAKMLEKYCAALEELREELQAELTSLQDGVAPVLLRRNREVMQAQQRINQA